jgi:hypothetical protein
MGSDFVFTYKHGFYNTMGDPESTRALFFWFRTRDDNKLTTREFRDKRAEALILTSPNAQHNPWYAWRPEGC